MSSTNYFNAKPVSRDQLGQQGQESPESNRLTGLILYATPPDLNATEEEDEYVAYALARFANSVGNMS